MKCCLRLVSSSRRLTGPSGATTNSRLPAPLSWSAARMTTPSAVESMNVAPPRSSTTTSWELAAPMVRIADSCGAAATSSSPEAVTRWALSSGSCSMLKSMAPPYPVRSGQGDDAQGHPADRGEQDREVAPALPCEQHEARDVDEDRGDDEDRAHASSVLRGP